MMTVVFCVGSVIFYYKGDNWNVRWYVQFLWWMLYTESVILFFLFKLYEDITPFKILTEAKDSKGDPIFNTIEMSVVCRECKINDIPNTCKHIGV